MPPPWNTSEERRASKYQLSFSSTSAVAGLPLPEDLLALLHLHCIGVDQCGLQIFADIMHPPPELKYVGSGIRSEWNGRIECQLVTMASYICQMAKHINRRAAEIPATLVMLSIPVLQYLRLRQLYTKMAYGRVDTLEVIQGVLPNVPLPTSTFLQTTKWVEIVLASESERLIVEMKAPYDDATFFGDNEAGEQGEATRMEESGN